MEISWGGSGGALGPSPVLGKMLTARRHPPLTSGTFLLHVEFIPLLVQARGKGPSELTIKPLEGQIQQINFYYSLYSQQAFGMAVNSEFCLQLSGLLKLIGN